MAIVAGVLAHMPMFWMGRYNGFRMVGMPMDMTMLVGMALIPVGLALATFGLMPRLEQMRAQRIGAHVVQFHVADGVPLNREHWKLVLVLVLFSRQQVSALNYQKTLTVALKKRAILMAKTMCWNTLYMAMSL